jgi:transposase-like protein
VRKYPSTLEDAIRFFSRPHVAERMFNYARWNQGNVYCPRCGSSHVSYLGDRYRRWECRNKHPSRQFTVKVGTIMEGSPLGLETWAVALWVVCHEKGVSSYELHGALRITQKSAWFLLHRVQETVRRKDARRSRQPLRRSRSSKRQLKSFQRWVRRVLAVPKRSTTKRKTTDTADYSGS